MMMVFSHWIQPFVSNSILWFKTLHTRDMLPLSILRFFSRNGCCCCWEILFLLDWFDYITNVVVVVVIIVQAAGFIFFYFSLHCTMMMMKIVKGLKWKMKWNFAFVHFNTAFFWLICMMRVEIAKMVMEVLVHVHSFDFPHLKANNEKFLLFCLVISLHCFFRLYNRTRTTILSNNNKEKSKEESEKSNWNQPGIISIVKNLCMCVCTVCNWIKRKKRKEKKEFFLCTFIIYQFKSTFPFPRIKITEIIQRFFTGNFPRILFFKKILK